MATHSVEYEMAASGDRDIIKDVNETHDMDKPSKNLANLYDIISILMDQAHAVIIALIFYREGENLYFWLTLLFMGINLLVMLMCRILRKLLGKDKHKVHLLKLYEAFVGCAPQAIFLLCIISIEAESLPPKDTRDTLVMLMVLRMLLLMAAALTDYQEMTIYHEQNCRYVFSRTEVFMYFMSCLGTIISRVLAIVLFGVMQPWITLGICSGHGLLMAIFIAIIRHRDKANAQKSILHKLFVDISVGIAYIIHYFKVIQRQDKLVVILYLTILHCENAVMMIIWFLNIKKGLWIRISAFCTFWASLFIGLAALVIYYKCFNHRMMKKLAISEKVSHEMENLTKGSKTKKSKS